MAGWGGKSAVCLAALGAVLASGCDPEPNQATEGFRECSDAQWARVTSGDELVEPVSCEFNDAQWDGADAFVIRVEHSRECVPLCTASGCSDYEVCPSKIATIADDGENLRFISDVEHVGVGELGPRLQPALGFDAAAVAGIELEQGAALQIVPHGDGLCLQVEPAPPLSGSYTDCGAAMADVELDYVAGVLPFDDALELAQPLVSPTGQWDSSNLAFLFDAVDVTRSRWSFVVHGRGVEVDMQGSVFRGDR